MLGFQFRLFARVLPPVLMLGLANSAQACGLTFEAAAAADPAPAPVILASSVTDGTSNTMMVGAAQPPATGGCSASACDGSVRTQSPRK